MALSGGIGGAKLALGLYKVLPPNHLSVVCNPGDDFEHFGLTICPDFDTVLYTLSELANPDLGWGRKDESWAFLDTIRSFGGEDWFSLGDRDLALHAERSRRLQAGATPTEVASHFTGALGIKARLLPPCDATVRTIVDTREHGALPFQRYFVAQRCEPQVTGFRFSGALQAEPSPALLACLADASLAAIIVCPSNPFISLDPMLAIPGLKAALQSSAAPVVAVSPLVGGAAVKGPTAKMMDELGVPRTNAAIAEHYQGLIDGLVVHQDDARAAADISIKTLSAQTLMTDLSSKEALANTVLRFAASLR